MHKIYKKSLIRNSVISLVSILLLIGVGVVVFRSSDGNLANQAVVEINSSSNSINPLSAVSKSDIAYQVASMSGMYESIPVQNQVESQVATQNVPVDDQLVAEPIILATSVKTRYDIVTYKVVAGDTLSSLAVKYGVTSQTITQSNGITNNSLVVDSTIYIPPVNGLVHVVKAGDTAQSLASTYNSNASDITTFNDAELSGLAVGERIVIPNGSISVPVTTYYSSSSNYSYTYGISAVYASNGYDFGQCTYYVAGKRASVGEPIPSNLGNAYSWYSIAQAEGLSTGLIPQVGAVIWFPSSYVSPLGHVGYVESLNADGSITISEMNWYGWDRVDTRTIPADQLSQNRYIY